MFGCHSHKSGGASVRGVHPRVAEAAEVATTPANDVDDGDNNESAMMPRMPVGHNASSQLHREAATLHTK